MKIKLKLIVIVESIAIALLIAYVGYLRFHKPDMEIGPQKTGLLSPRIYAGILKPKSFLISNFEPLRDKLEDYIKKYNLNVSIYVQNLRNGAEMEINGDIGLFPASLNKLPIGVLVLQEIERRQLRLDSTIHINGSDKNDPSSELYGTNQSDFTVKFLLEEMLQKSDNTAFYALLAAINKNDLAALLNYFNLDPESTYLMSKGVQDMKNVPNFVSPKDVSNMFRSLYLSTVLEQNDSEYLLTLLTDTVFDIKKVAALPANVMISHKYGSFYGGSSKYFHDCGIIYSGDSRILYCIMTKDMDNKEAILSTGIFVNAIYNYLNVTRTVLDVYKERGYI